MKRPASRLLPAGRCYRFTRPARRTALSCAVSLVCALSLQQAIAADRTYIYYQDRPLFELEILGQGEATEPLPSIYTEGDDWPDQAVRDINAKEAAGLQQAAALWAEILGNGAVNTSPVRIQIVGLGQDYANAAAATFPNLDASSKPLGVVGSIGQITQDIEAQFPLYVLIGQGLDFQYAENWHPLSDGRGFDYLSTIFHEFGHALGINFSYDYELNYNNFLYDVRGQQYEHGMKIMCFDELTDDDLDDLDQNVFLVGKEAQSEVYFCGEHVSEVLAGSDLRGIPVNGYECEDIDCVESISVELSHFELERSMMSHQNYRNYTFFMEAELAAMQDLGYSIDRKNYYGRSVYGDGQTIVNTQGFYARNAEGSAYLTGVVNTATLGTGLHIYGSSNTVTQAADLLAGGTGGTGIRVDGANNTVTVTDGVQVRADGTNGTGVLFAYGKNHVLNAGGTITALGSNGVALRFDFGGNLLSNDTELRGSYIWYAEGKDLLYGKNESGNWGKAYTDYSGFEIINDDALMSEVNISGTIAGSQAAIYISDNALVQEINVLPGAAIYGNIISKWDPANPLLSDYVTEVSDIDLTTALNFGNVQSTRSDLQDFGLTLYGSIDGQQSLDLSLHDGELTVTGYSKTLSLTNHGELTVLGSDDNGVALTATTLSLNEGSVLRLPAGAVAETESANLGGNLELLLAQDYYCSGDKQQTKVTFTGNISGNFEQSALGALSPTLNFTGISSTTESSTDAVSVVTSATVSRSADAYAQYADSPATTAVGFALLGLTDSAASPYADLLAALDFSSLSGSDIRKALHSISAESYSAAAQSVLRQLQTEERQLQFSQWAEALPARYGTHIYGNLLYSGYDSDGASWDSQGFSAVVGADTRISPALSAGINLTLSTLSTDVSGDNEASYDAVTALAGLRAIYRPASEGFYLQGSVRAGLQEGDMDRSVRVNGYRAELDSDWLAFTGSANTAVGYDLLFIGPDYKLRTGPFAGANYALLHTPDIDESGGAALVVDSSTYDSLPLELGWRFKLEQDLSPGNTVMLAASAAFFHDTLDDEDHTEAAFRYDSAPAFDSELERDRRSGAYLNLSAGFNFINGFSAGLNCGFVKGPELDGFNVAADFAYRF